MTVTNTTNSVYYIGNGTNAFYAYGFPVPQLDGFTVTRITRSTGARLDITGACTITGIGGPSGGLVTMPGGAPLAAIYDLEIKRELPLEQTTDFSNQSTVYPETIEAALDYLTMCLIDLANEGDPNALHLNGGVWDAESIRITNVADAVSANDAVNYDQMVTEINAAIAAALSGSGNVPAPTGGETNYVLTATGAGTFDWVAPSGSVADGSITNAKLADMATRCEAARLLVEQAARKYDTGERCDMEAGMAKLFASEAGVENSLEAMRIFGGYSYSVEFDVERYYRDSPLMCIGEGTNEMQRVIIAKQLIERNAL